MCGSPGAEYDLEALRSQDVATFDRLVLDHQPLVLGLCRSMGLRGADVEETAVDVFSNVYLALPGFHGRAKVTTWLYRIACRTILRAQAQLRRHRTRGAIQSSREATGPQPGEWLECQETCRRIWDAVAQLEPRQAMAVELYYRWNWPLQEIATAMGSPVGSVKTWLFRAREELRQVFVREEMLS